MPKEIYKSVTNKLSAKNKALPVKVVLAHMPGSFTRPAAIL